MRPSATHFGAIAQPLDDLLGATSRVRVLRALDRASGPVSLSKLAADSGLTYNATASALALLEQSGLITAVPVGRTSVYTLSPEHPFAAPLQQLFAAERERRRAIQTAIEKWAHEQPETLRAVWLFGSVARREDTFQSDMDIALVADDQADAHHYADALRETLAPIAERQRLHPSVMPYDRREIEAMPRGDRAMWSNLTRDAVPLYGPGPATLLDQLKPHRRKPAPSRKRSAR